MGDGGGDASDDADAGGRSVRADGAGGVTTFHGIRMFKQVVGITPYAYALQLRIARARALLRSGRNVTAVAHEVGFADQGHLHRPFKRIVGVTPGHHAKGASLVPGPAESSAR